MTGDLEPQDPTDIDSGRLWHQIWLYDDDNNVMGAVIGIPVSVESFPERWVARLSPPGTRSVATIGETELVGSAATHVEALRLLIDRANQGNGPYQRAQPSQGDAS